MTIDLLIYLDVFSSNLWLGVVGVAVSLSICFYLIARLRIGKMHDAKDSESFGLLNSMALVMLVYMQRDYSVQKRDLSAR